MLEPLAEDLRGAVLVERDPVQHRRDLHRALLVRDDHDLRVAREPRHQPQEPVEIEIVERRLHLIHQVERRGACREDREEERERREGPFAAREQRDPLDALASGTRLDLDPRLERVGRIRRTRRPSPPGNSSFTSRSNCVATSRNAESNVSWIS